MKPFFWLTLPLFLAMTALAQESYEAKPTLIYPGGLVVFFSSEGPLSYNMLSHSELPPGAIDMGRVSGESCQYGLSIPLFISGTNRASLAGAQGNGGYNKTLQNMTAQYPGLGGIYDVMVDLHTVTILGIFSKLCTDINARGYR